MSKSVVLTPTYNERENIALIVPEIFARCPDVHVLVIDDSSPDGTADVVREMMKQYKNLSLLSRPRKQGLGEAYKAGMEKVLVDADVERVITMDADGSHDAEYLPALISAAEDLAIGSRYVRGGSIENWEKWRYALSAGGNLYARTLTGLPIMDLTSGFMSYRASKLRQVDFSQIHASGYAFLMEMKFAMVRTLHGSAKEVPIIFRSRREGESKISRHIISEGLKTPLKLFKKRFRSV
jgi:dolichol-phosphate mannosyltransferase